MASEDVNERHRTRKNSQNPVYLSSPVSHKSPMSHFGRQKVLYFSHLELVEAAGVEPASENVTGQKPTCVVAFMPLALPKDVRGRRSERTRNGCR